MISRPIPPPTENREFTHPHRSIHCDLARAMFEAEARSLALTAGAPINILDMTCRVSWNSSLGEVRFVP